MSIITVSVVVPASGDGPVADVSSIVGAKTVQLAGTFSGYYDLLASQDDLNFVAVASFDAGGPEGITLTIEGSFKSVRLRSQATVRLAPVTCEISGTGGTNGFGTIASLSAGASGLTPVVDLATIVSPTGPEIDTCLICRGSFQGAIVVLGSLDGEQFNPVGEFRVDRRAEGAPAAVDLSPLQIQQKIRYARLLVNAVVTGPVTVTLGGSVPATGGMGTPMLLYVSDASGSASYQALSVVMPSTIGALAIVVGQNTVDGSDRNVVAQGDSCVVGPGASNVIVVGDVVTAAAGGSATFADLILLGRAITVQNSSPSTDYTASVVALGDTITVTANTISNPDIADVVALGSVLTLVSRFNGADFGTHAVLIGDNLSAGTTDGVCNVTLIGTNIELGDQCLFNLVMGNAVTVADNCVRNIIIDTLGDVEVTGSRNVAIGEATQLGSAVSSAVLVGSGNDFHAVRVETGSTGAVAVNGRVLVNSGPSVAIGYGSIASTAGDGVAIALGPYTTAGANQFVVGSNVGPTIAPINELIVYGLAAGPVPVETIHARTNPATGELGLSLTYNSGSAIATRTLKVAAVAPVGALLVYVDS